ncbi:hypothetical protein [Desulfosporosinus sp. SB140]
MESEAAIIELLNKMNERFDKRLDEMEKYQERMKTMMGEMSRDIKRLVKM